MWILTVSGEANGQVANENDSAARTTVTEQLSKDVEIAEAGLQAAAGFVKTVLPLTQAEGVPEGLTSLIVELHNGALLSIPHLPEVQEAVARCCLDYWCAKAPLREQICVGLVRAANEWCLYSS